MSVDQRYVIIIITALFFYNFINQCVSMVSHEYMILAYIVGYSIYGFFIFPLISK